MLGSVERDSWTALETRLRAFVSRRIANSSDVDDVLQEILIRVHRGLNELRADERFGPWTYKIARNALVDYQRARARAVKHEGPSSEDVEDTLVADESAEQELAGCLVSFIASLPEIYRQALTLAEIDGVPQARIAATLGISLSNVKARIARGRQKLRRAIDDACLLGLDVRGQVTSCETRPRVEPSHEDGPGQGSCCASPPSTNNDDVSKARRRDARSRALEAPAFATMER